MLKYNYVGWGGYSKHDVSIFSGHKSCTLNKQMNMIIIETRYVIILKTPENNYSKGVYIDDRRHHG